MFRRLQNQPRFLEWSYEAAHQLFAMLEPLIAWINMLTGSDKAVPKGWIDTTSIPIITENTVWKQSSNQAAG